MTVLNRDHKIICYTLGVVLAYAEAGVLSQPNGVTAKGHRACREVVASGFRPTEDEILQALTALAGKKILKFRSDEDRDAVKTMVVEYRPAMPH